MPKLTDVWIEGFAAGTHKDSMGREKTWTQEDIDKAVDTYAPDNYEAPTVIGHPADNMPAYGWIDQVKRVGEGMASKLMLKLKDTMPAFETMVKERRFPKRSMSFFGDGRIRHLGFLGAAPPAVEGLMNIELSGESGAEIEFDITQEDPMPENNKSGEETQDHTVEELQKKLKEKDDEIASLKSDHSSQDEKIKNLEEKYDNFVAEQTKSAEQVAAEARDQVADTHVKSGAILEADKPLVVAFAKAVEDGSKDLEPMNFTEKGEKKPLLKHFWEFIGARKPVVDDSSNGLFKNFGKDLEDDHQKTPEDAEKAQEFASNTLRDAARRRQRRKPVGQTD